MVTKKTGWRKLKTAGYCWYKNNEVANKSTYWALYNWHAVNTGKLCPKGWHVPTDKDWKQLEMNLGMDQSNADGENWRGTKEGKKLKSIIGWDQDSNGTDKVGFTAFPVGYRSSNGSFDYLGYSGSWWSATEDSSNDAWGRYLGYSSDRVGRDSTNKENGFSVRCVRD